MNAIILAHLLSENAKCFLFTRLDTQSRNATIHALNIFREYAYEFPIEIILSNIPAGEVKCTFKAGDVQVSERAAEIIHKLLDKIQGLNRDILYLIPFDEEYLLEHKIITVNRTDISLFNSYKSIAEYLEHWS